MTILIALVALCAAPYAQAHNHSEAQPASSSSSSSVMNPDISLDGLFGLAGFSKDSPVVFDTGHDPRQNGFNIQQIELSMGANVDPYLRGDANLVIMPGGIEIEEAYATTLGLPWSLQLKAGQFFTAIGRHNTTHPHSWDWANKPLVLGRLMGGDGLRTTGVQISWLLPLPWYSELTGSVQNSMGETAASFAPGGSIRGVGDALYLARWANFVSPTDALSANWGVSYLQGANATSPGGGLRNLTRIVGTDLLLKWRQPDSLGYVSLQTEVLQRYYDLTGERLGDTGAYSQLDVRLPGEWNRWHVGVRYDWVGFKRAPVKTAGEMTLEDGTVVDRDTDLRHRISPVITFYPSEFSKVRVQYDYDRATSFTQHTGILQLEFLMGAHGAHKF